MALPDPTKISMRAEWYNEHCGLQLAAMRHALPLVPSFSGHKELTIVDYGCCQGSNSIEPLEKVLSSLPSDSTVHLHFEDTAHNDFQTLAKTLDAEIPKLRRDKSTKIFTSMIPTGFYSPVVPDATVDLGVSWSSMNYLEHQPDLKLDAGAGMPAILAARKVAMQKAGKESLAKFLKLRAAEIKPGGYFVTAVGGSKPEGETFISEAAATPLGPAVMKMIQEGKLAPEESMRFISWPSYDIAIEDLDDVLAQPEMAALWEKESAEVHLVEHGAWKKYRADLVAAGDDEEAKTRAAETYAKTVITNVISSSGAFWASILKESRGEDWHGEDDFIQEVTELGIAELVKNHRDLRVAYWYNFLRLRRKAN